MRLSKTLLALFAAAAFAGCGSDDDATCGDAACPDGSVSTLDGGATDASGQMLWGLSRGENMYNVTKVAVTSDTCESGVAALMGMAIPAKYDDTTATFSFGKDFGTPAQPAFGSGKVGANMATLMRDNQAGDPAKCYWHQTDVSNMKLTNHDQFTLDVTETLNMFSAMCTGADAPPAGGTCTAVFQLTLELKK